MATTEQHVPTAAERIREAAAALARRRGGPCLVFISRSLVHADVLTVRTALGSARGDHLDVIVAGPGGVSESAYLLSRELRRRFTRLTVYVPFEAKSAATLLCLAADELVLGSLGELGPLDQQYNEKQTADYPLSTSRLLPGVALRQLHDGATAVRHPGAPDREGERPLAVGGGQQSRRARRCPVRAPRPAARPGPVGGMCSRVAVGRVRRTGAAALPTNPLGGVGPPTPGAAGAGLPGSRLRPRSRGTRGGGPSSSARRDDTEGRR